MKTHFNPERWYNRVWFKHLTIALDVLFLITLLIYFLGRLPVFWNIVWIFYFILAINTIFLALKINKIPEEQRDNKSWIYYVSHLFILILVLIAVNQFLKRDIITNLMPYLIGLAISSGFLTFFTHKNKVEKALEDEKSNEELKERKRKEEFDNKFKTINKIPILRLIVRWMYKEGWIYSLLFLLSVLTSLFLRLYYLDYIDGLDNFTIVAVKNIYENGLSYYIDSFIQFNLMVFFSKMFGYNMLSLRLTSIIFSIITVIAIYFIAKNFNKKVAIISCFLFAISPWSIIVSRITRGYSYDCMVGVLILLICISLFKKFKYYDDYKKIANSLILLILITLFVFFFSLFNGRSQTLLAIIIPFITIIWLLFLIDTNQKPLKKYSTLIKLLRILSIPTLIIIFLLAGFSDFSSGLIYNKTYFDYLFNPGLNSPWQWFHNNMLTTGAIFFLFLTPLLFSINFKKRSKTLILYLYSIFFFGLALFIFKFIPHANDYPTRYIYVLFPIYVILFSISIFFILKLKGKIYSTLLAILLIILLVNVSAIYYATYPPAWYMDGNTKDLQIDSIGVGRFSLIPVVIFIKSDLNWSQDKTFVFAGRFAEFIYPLNYSIDPSRYVDTSNCNICYQNGYDIGKNMYVESSFWNIHELERATQDHSGGYFVTEDYCITNNGKNYLEKPEENSCVQILGNSNFQLYNKNFTFITQINGYKIYSWI